MDGSRGAEHSAEEEPTQQGGRGSLITPQEGLEGARTHRSMEQAGGGDCLVHRWTSMLGPRQEICEGHLGGGVHAVLEKIIIKQFPGDC